MSTSKIDNIKQKALITIGLLFLYRLMTFIPIPFIDVTKLLAFSEATKKGIFGMFNAFSGGSISRASIFSLGIMPYITSSIIVQLVTSTSPDFKKLKKESHDIWQKKINSYTKYLAIIIGFGQGMAFGTGLIKAGLNFDMNINEFKIFTAIFVVTGTFITLWFAEFISGFGIGNGTSLIIAMGIIAEAPKDLANVVYMSKIGAMSAIMSVGVIVLFIVNIVVVVTVEKTQRLIPIQYPRQVSQMMKIQSPFLPLKINLAGVIPPIFASAVLLLPITIIGFFVKQDHYLVYFISNNLTHGKTLFIILYISLIFVFSLVYNNIIFDPSDISSQLRRSNVFIPGCRPGEATEALLKKITRRLSIIGGFYLGFICLFPEILSKNYGYSFLVGGTGILIIVNVITDTAMSIQSAMMSGKYGKVMQKYKK